MFNPYTTTATETTLTIITPTRITHRDLHAPKGGAALHNGICQRRPVRRRQLIQHWNISTPPLFAFCTRMSKFNPYINYGNHPHQHHPHPHHTP